MRNKEGKRITFRFLNFRYRECGALEEYLHRMSLKGWHFCGWRYGMVFEEGEPSDVEYDAEVFTKSKETDLRPENEAEEYAEYCRAAGWEFVDANRRFCVFRRLSSDDVPIVTEEERFYEVWKAERRVVFGQTAVVLLMTAGIWYFVWSWQMVNWMFLNFAMFLFLCFPVFSAGYLLQTLFLLIWYFTGKRKLEKGEKVRYSLRIGYRIENLAMFLSLFLVVSWAFLEGYYNVCLSGLVAFLFFCVLRAGESFFRLSREARFRAEMLGFVGYVLLGTTVDVWVPVESIYQTRNVSILGSSENGELAGTDITYELYRSDIPWVMDMVWDRQKGDQEPGWEIESPREVSYNYGKRSFRYEDAILVLTYSEDEPNREQIRSLQDRYKLREREVI